MINFNKHNQQNNQPQFSENNPQYSTVLADIPRLFSDGEIPINDNPARLREDALRLRQSASYASRLKQTPVIFRDSETPINDNTVPRAPQPSTTTNTEPPEYTKTWPKNYTPDSYFTHTWPTDFEPDYARTWPKNFNHDTHTVEASRKETAPSLRFRRIQRRLGGIATAAFLTHFREIDKKTRRSRQNWLNQTSY